jgi:hypothetical protein
MDDIQDLQNGQISTDDAYQQQWLLAYLTLLGSHLPLDAGTLA